MSTLDSELDDLLNSIPFEEFAGETKSERPNSKRKVPSTENLSNTYNDTYELGIEEDFEDSKPPALLVTLDNSEDLHGETDPSAKMNKTKDDIKTLKAYIEKFGTPAQRKLCGYSLKYSPYAESVINMLGSPSKKNEAAQCETQTQAETETINERQHQEEPTGNEDTSDPTGNEDILNLTIAMLKRALIIEEENPDMKPLLIRDPASFLSRRQNAVNCKKAIYDTSNEYDTHHEHPPSQPIFGTVAASTPRQAVGGWEKLYKETYGAKNTGSDFGEDKYSAHVGGKRPRNHTGNNSSLSPHLSDIPGYGPTGASMPMQTGAGGGELYKDACDAENTGQDFSESNYSAHFGGNLLNDSLLSPPLSSVPTVASMPRQAVAGGEGLYKDACGAENTGPDFGEDKCSAHFGGKRPRNNTGNDFSLSPPLSQVPENDNLDILDGQYLYVNDMHLFDEWDAPLNCLIDDTSLNCLIDDVNETCSLARIEV